MELIIGGTILVVIGVELIVWEIVQSFRRPKEMTPVPDSQLPTATTRVDDFRHQSPREAPPQTFELAARRLESEIPKFVSLLREYRQVSLSYRHEALGPTARQILMRLSPLRKELAELAEMDNAVGSFSEAHKADSVKAGHGLPQTGTERRLATAPPSTTEAPGSIGAASSQTGEESSAEREKPGLKPVLFPGLRREKISFSAPPLPDTCAEPGPKSMSLEEVVSIWNSSGPARSLDLEELSSRLGPRWRVRKIYGDKSPTAFFLLEDREGPVGRRLFILPGIGEWFTAQVQALFPCDETVGKNSDVIVDRVEKPASFCDESRVTFDGAELRHLLAPGAVVQGKVRTRPG